MMAGFSDRCLFLVRWGITTREQVLSGLRRLALYNVAVNGIVLSHVNLRRHAQLAAGEGYYRSYGRLPGYNRSTMRHRTTPWVARVGPHSTT
jgi:hypothetical protein